MKATDTLLSRSQLFRRFYKYLTPYIFQIFLAFSALCGAALTILFMGNGLHYLIDKGFTQGDASLMNKAIISLIFCGFILALTSFMRILVTTRLSEQVAKDLRLDLFKHILSLNQLFLESAKVGDLMGRLESDITQIRIALRTSAAVCLRSLIQLCGATSLLLYTSLKLTGFAFSVIALSLIPLIGMGYRKRSISYKSQKIQENLSAYTLEILASLKSVQSFCQEQNVFHKQSELVSDSLQDSLKGAWQRAFMIASIIAVVFSSIGFILWMGTHAVFNHEMTFGELSAFIFYAIVAAGSLNSLSEVGNEIILAFKAFSRIIEILTIKPKPASPSSSLYLTKKESGQSFLEFKNVTFHYPSRPLIPALETISFNIARGQTLALVGPSGAGKSTIFHIIQRFYDPQEGQVIYEGIDNQAWPLDHLRKSMAIVPQDPPLFHTTLWDNIRFSRPDASPSEVFEAAHLAYVDEFASNLPNGYQTIIGEQGMRLSGGQKQRLAIARAILYQAPLLLLDEATNALDPLSEYQVQMALDQAFKGRTRIIIAHRLSTVLKADKILVMSHGKIVEEGTHHTLLTQGNLYAHLATHQLYSASVDSEPISL